MQLHYLAPRGGAPERELPPRSDLPAAGAADSGAEPRAADAPVFAGTSDPHGGVEPGRRSGAVSPAGGGGRRGTRTWLGLFVVGLASLSLLGQGEDCRVDPRFVSPGSTLQTYWDALRRGDAEVAWECLIEGRHDLPLPGSLWFLPPTDTLLLDNVRSLPVTSGRVVVSYDVLYTPRGIAEIRSFRTGDELVRERGAWRIARPLGEASMPEWEPIPLPVDI